MPKGLSKCHPITEAALGVLGVSEAQVVQAYGSAPASAGFHQAEGKYQGEPYSSCVDLTWNLATLSFFHRMADAGFAVFFRDWPGNRHIHAVHVGLRDDNGTCHILPGPRQQIIDWCNGLDGLKNHAPLKVPYRPSRDERSALRKQYAEWVPDYATTVISPENKRIRCYAFLEGDTVNCDIDAFLAWWGYAWDPAAGQVKGNGKEIPVPGVTPALTGGQWLRGPIRPFAEAIGLKPAFESVSGGTAYRVRLSY